MKIIAILMVKNEQENLLRVLRNLPADAIAVIDTGSTDDTVNLAKRIIGDKPGVIHEIAFQGFGITRTKSFYLARNYTRELGWKDEETYGLLLDADYELENHGFNKSQLSESGYSLIQYTNNLEYYNTRLIRFDVDWKCVGIVHEYWIGGSRTLLKTLKIKDHVSRCSNAKQLWYRDLLLKGIKEEPKNERYMFYLAQTYNTLGDTKNAIKWYVERTKHKGFKDEVWYSMYQLVKIYSTSNLELMEYWTLRALALDNNRSETLIVTARALKKAGNVTKSRAYSNLVRPMPDVGLFLEPEMYEEPGWCAIL